MQSIPWLRRFGSKNGFWAGVMVAGVLAGTNAIVRAISRTAAASFTRAIRTSAAVCALLTTRRPAGTTRLRWLEGRPGHRVPKVRKDPSGRKAIRDRRAPPAPTRPATRMRQATVTNYLMITIWSDSRCLRVGMSSGLTSTSRVTRTATPTPNAGCGQRWTA